MKNVIFGVVASLALTTAALADDMKLAVTTSFHNSGLAEILLPEIKADLDLDVQLLVVGTGQAIRLGEAGDAPRRAMRPHPRRKKLSPRAQASGLSSCI